MYLLTNGRLITRDPEHPYYEKGAVVFDGPSIVAVGEEAALRKAYPQAEVIDAKGGVIMPAFINAHTHIYSALALVPARVRCRSMYHHWPSRTS